MTRTDARKLFSIMDRADHKQLVNRLRDIAAYGPCTYRPATDRTLLSAGWIEPYAARDAVDLVDGRAAVLFDQNGRLNSALG